MTDHPLGPEPSSRTRLRETVDRVARLLPGQGPINVFIHHNTLHAFEDRAFEDAVVEAGRLFGCRPYLMEETYRAELRRGRISADDVRGVLDLCLGERGRDELVGHTDRLELQSRLAVYGLVDAREPMLSWLLEEEGRHERLRPDLAGLPHMDETTAEGASHPEDLPGESVLARALWRACLDAVDRSGPAPAPEVASHVRHRDVLLAATGHDIDASVDPVLIRFLSAFLDQGMAHWELAGRERGIYAAFGDTYGAPSWLTGPLHREISRLWRDDASAGRDAVQSLEHSLHSLGLPEGEWFDCLAATALVLRGFAGMVHQMGVRPDRMPVRSFPSTLLDYLSVRLLCERAALAQATHRLGLGSTLVDLRERLRDRTQSAPRPATARERAWRLFQAVQLVGVRPAQLEDLSDVACRALEREIDAFDSRERREVLHLAFERRLRHRFLDALTQHRPEAQDAPPRFQAIFCLDEREESFRRHLEEVEPRAETFGAAGFFGVAMYYRGATDARPRPLCPPTIRPTHHVTEVRETGEGARARLVAFLDRAVALANKNLHVSSRTLARGAILMSVLGTLSLVPLVLRVLAPRLAGRLGRSTFPLRAPVRSSMRIRRDHESPRGGAQQGFDLDEMAEIVAAQLASLGLAGSLAPLVLVVAHGSDSLNNPHESAHDCGACGGGAGGPNARAFALMANDPAVRERLAQRGVPIPETTWFVGAQRNTASNEVLFFDEDRVGESNREALAHVHAAFREAREREALERCRRFDGLPSAMSGRAALRHVEARAADLAQPRPEFGHASNAFCVVGRRARTRGLFLDRRAFLVSYDPTRDSDGSILGRLLAAVVPVVAGINLEYYFSTVDPVGYGCGTKLPHNVTGLLGVMDGAQSDLRTGLPWQMVEIHEPVRLSILVESPCERLRGALGSAPDIARLQQNRWIHFACLDPGSGAIWELSGDEFRLYRAEEPLVEIEGPSSRWFQGQSGHLGIARVRGAERPSA